MSCAPFGSARRPRRVHDHGRVIARAVSDLGHVRLVDGPFAESVRRDDDADHTQVVNRVVGLGQALVPTEQQRGAGVSQEVLHLARLEQHVHRHDHRAGSQRAVVGDRELGHVREHERDAVAGLDTQPTQQLRAVVGGCVQLPVAQRALAEPHRNPVRMALRGGDQVQARLSFIWASSVANSCR